MYPLGGRQNLFASRTAQASAPLEFPFTLIGDHLEGFWRFDSNQIAQGPGSLIAQCFDQSGQGRDALQVSGGPDPRPDFDTSTGQGAGVFVGGQFMSIDDTFATALGSDNFTMWAVLRADDTSGTVGMLNIGSSVALAISSAAWQMLRVGGGLTTDGSANTNPHLMVVTRVSGTFHMYLDGSEVSLSAPTGAINTPSGVTLMGALQTNAYFFIGLLFETGGVSRVLTSPELDSLWTYVRAHYSVL